MATIEGIFQQITQFIASDPPRREHPDYLAIKNGILPLTASFSSSPDPQQSFPTFKIAEGFPDHIFHSAGSASHECRYGLGDVLGWEETDLDGLICDNIIEESVRATSLRLCQNKNNEIGQIEDELSEIVQSGAVDVKTFSRNCITNLTSYDLDGNPIGISDVIVDAQNKEYVEWTSDELVIYSKMPHPIRPKKKVKRRPMRVEKKSTREVLEEFEILNAMFDEKSIVKQDSDIADKVLNVVNLVDNSYLDLWEKIVGDIKVQGEQVKKQKTTSSQGPILEKDFDIAIQRIMNEAIEFEKEKLDIEPEDEEYEEEEEKEEEAQQGVMQEDAKPEPEPLSSFEATKIVKKVALTPSSKYQYAIEDESDLTNFYDLLPKEKFATQYSFELDQFQKRSVLHLQKKESVFVAAHTSAGKTVVAEYGIALAIKHKRKVVYTSPIKALSNQKYRELSIKFGSENVGIVTGDVSMNQQANCVIMTTEILRNNLYRGAEMIRDIEWVIFDEVHYINNQERGVVWEETIIMLPEHIGIIMLSATVPNYMDFANWVGRTKHRTIFVMKTLHRPVPLEHSLYIFNKFHVIKEANGRFLKEEYGDLKHEINLSHTNHDIRNKALKEQKKKKIEERGFYNDNRREQRLQRVNKMAVDKFIKKITKADLETADGREDFRILEELIVDCNKKKLLPCVIFTFSKKKINALASKLYLYDLTNHSEKSKIMRRISSALSNLKPEDRCIEQFQFLTTICLNGYAVHHGDLLPLAKEIVELLFSQGLIKVLFATETFAMGINMPTKTVIFNSIKKVTGSSGLMRFLNSSEYVQMSGRAGRRGLDEKGTVIIIVQDPSNLPETSEMEKMVDHPGEMLSSKFKVSYQIILNLLNSTDFGVTEMMQQSFLENPKFSEFASNVRALKNYQKEYHNLSEFECPFNKLGTRLLIDEYMGHSSKLKEEAEDLFMGSLLPSVNNKNPLAPRFAKFMGYNNETIVGMLLKFDGERQKKTNKGVQVMVVVKMNLEMELDKEEREQIEKTLGIKKKVVLEYEEDTKASNMRHNSGPVPGTNNAYFYYVHYITPGMVLEVYSNKIGYRHSVEDKKEVYEELANELLAAPANLTPLPNMSSPKKDDLWKLFQTSSCHDCEFKEKHQHQNTRRYELKTKLTDCAKKLDTNELGMMGSFEGMLLLLSSYQFIKQSVKEPVEGQSGPGEIVNTLTLKGRIAKQVDIYVAEIVVEAILDDLDYSEIAALMSAFVCDYKPRPGRNEDSDAITPIPKKTEFTSKLARAIGKTLHIVEEIANQEEELQAYVNLTANSMEEHVMSIVNFHLCDTVYKWAIGFDFNEAKAETKAPEGTIVRTIMRLSQLLEKTKAVCRIIGNSELEEKIETSLQAIKRDIVFCQSLYLTG